MSRIEMKFLLSFTDYVVFRDRIVALARQDAHGVKQGRYPVYSRYFDTEDLLFYRDKMNGEWEHVKFRVRKYATGIHEPGPAFLEAKVKHNFNQKKLRIRHDDVEALLDPSRWSSLEEPDAHYFVEWASRVPLLPVCNVYYEREAFALDFGGEPIRLNFDTSITALYPREDRVTLSLIETRPVLPDSQVLLEIKYSQAELPEMMRRQLETIDVARTTFSKYAETLNILDATNLHWEVQA